MRLRPAAPRHLHPLRRRRPRPLIKRTKARTEEMYRAEEKALRLHRKQTLQSAVGEAADAGVALNEAANETPEVPSRDKFARFGR